MPTTTEIQKQTGSNIVRWATSLDEQTSWSPYTARVDGGSPNCDDLAVMLEIGREMEHRTGPVDRVTARGDKDEEQARKRRSPKQKELQLIWVDGESEASYRGKFKVKRGFLDPACEERTEARKSNPCTR
jgi:hypothetical protein